MKKTTIIDEIKKLIVKYKSVRSATYAISQLEDLLADVDRGLKRGRRGHR